MQNTPFSYYGGKQSIVHNIIDIIPTEKNVVYVEPFFGGGAVFFNKKQQASEMINDNNDILINFYKVLQNNFSQLYKKIKETIYSETIYKICKTKYKTNEYDNDIDKAFCWWFLIMVSFSSVPGATFGTCFIDRARPSVRFHNAKKRLKIAARRLEKVEIYNRDAIKIIKQWGERDNVFFYCDPPYVNTYQGHYGGYTADDFQELLDELQNIKGKFILSTYDNEQVHIFKKKYKIKKIKTKCHTLAYNQYRGFVNKEDKERTELLIYNYEENNKLF